MNTRVVLALLLALSSAPVLAAEPPLRPDATVTPGAIDQDASGVDPATGRPRFCVKGYTSGKTALGRNVRNVSQSTKKEVFRLYGLDYPPAKGEFEVDHLISLELGGSNSIKNLWPQSYQTSPYNARDKDKLENRLRKEVCQHGMPVDEAQRAISQDWIKTYERYYPAKD